MNIRCRGAIAVAGASFFFACSGPLINQDRKPELAKSNGYYVSQDEAHARGGVGNYVPVTSWKDRDQLNTASRTEPVTTASNERTIPSDRAIPSLKDYPETVYFNTGDS